MEKNIVILGNSIRRGCHCIGGIEVFWKNEKLHYGSWIRPISNHGEGEVSTDECICDHGMPPAVLDVVRISLTAKQECPYQPENYLINNSVKWKKIGKYSKEHLAVFEEQPTDLWMAPHGRIDRIHTKQLKLSPNFQSIYLIRPNRLHFRIWQAPDIFRGNTRKHRRAIFEYAGAEYNLPITDPTMDHRYFQKCKFPNENEPPKDLIPSINNKHMLVISLSPPFKDGFHYKIVASCIEY